MAYTGVFRVLLIRDADERGASLRSVYVFGYLDPEMILNISMWH